MTSDEYIDAVRLLPCCICGAPANAHHGVGGSVALRLGARGNRRHSDWIVMPLCHRHHQGEDGLHLGVLSWERRFGTQVHWITATGEKLNVDPWGMERADYEAARKPYKRAAKVMPRRFV